MLRDRVGKGVFLGIALVLLTGTMGGSPATLPPRSGMAAPPVSVKEQNPRFDPTWVSHRGQVILFLYASKDSPIPQETIERIGEMQQRWSPGFQVAVMTEGSEAPTGLHPDIIVVQDDNGKTRSDYQITEDREYFLIDRYGRLRRQRIRPSFIERALAESFDASWIGFSGAWNQSYFVYRDQFLMYLADTVPDTAAQGDIIELRLIALPTFDEPRKKTQIYSPIQVEVQTDGAFEESVYRGKLEEDVQVSTEIWLQMKLRQQVEPGLHMLRVTARHKHCGFGDCLGFQETVPIPIWVE